ncbi:MAG: acetolactate synthase small subunit, partial [Lachnospiraceae bacterium]|nr:acetolactate synthase small subunit [Lachnospiraceae bacterium]
VEVIKVVNYTDTSIHMKEILFVKINYCSDADITELFRISKVFKAEILDYDGSAVLLDCTQKGNSKDDLISLLRRKFTNRIEIVRGGSVAIEAINIEKSMCQ